jgi:hypothetical protein
MASFLDNLIARRNAIAAELAGLSVSKPDYSIDGESINHASNRTALMNEMKMLDDMITEQSGPTLVYHTG